MAASGRVDAATAGAFEAQIDVALAGGAQKMVLNLEGVDYISSAGLRSILAAAKKMSARQGRLMLAGMKGTVREVMEIAGFLSIFKSFPTVSEAVQALQTAG